MREFLWQRHLSSGSHAAMWLKLLSTSFETLQLTTPVNLRNVRYKEKEWFSWQGLDFQLSWRCPLSHLIPTSLIVHTAGSAADRSAAKQWEPAQLLPVAHTSNGKWGRGYLCTGLGTWRYFCTGALVWSSCLVCSVVLSSWLLNIQVWFSCYEEVLSSSNGKWRQGKLVLVCACSD